MSLDLAFDDDQLALESAVGHFCERHCDDGVVRGASGGFTGTLWRELAALGVLAAGSPGGDGGALEICAAMEALGRAAFPGPLPETFLAMQVLEAGERDGVADGARIVSCGTPPLMPFAPVAHMFFEIAGPALYRAELHGDVESVAMLGGEPWGRVALQRGPRIAGSRRALAIAEMARAAYMAALAQRLVEEVAEHAGTRRQFGRSIGEFQAVSHPLVDCHMRLAAGRSLARRAAWRLDEGDLDEAEAASASARLSCAGGAVEAAHAAHQIYGAIGITLEGPAFHLTRRIRQLASAAPGADHAREQMLTGLGLASA